MIAPGSLLAQLTTTAGPVLAYSAVHQTEITRIVACNNGATNDKFSLWHADEGQAATAGCALYIGNTLSGNSTLVPVSAATDGGGITVKAGGRFYCGSSGTDVVTFSIYGNTRAGR